MKGISGITVFPLPDFIKSGYSPEIRRVVLPTATRPAAINSGTYQAFGITAELPDGTIWIFYRDGTSHAGAGDYAVIKGRKSTDRGYTWSGAVTIASEAGVDLRMGGGGVTPSGRLIVFYKRYNPDTATHLSLGYIYSDDYGVTRSAYTAIPQGVETSGLPHGELISIGDGKLMQPWYGSHAGPTYGIYVITSDDDGLTWGAPVAVYQGATLYGELSICYLGGETILALARSEVDTCYIQFLSTDGGATWVNQGLCTFDSSNVASPACLKSFRDRNGEMAVACFYGNRQYGFLRVILGRPSSLISGVSGWDTDTIVNLGTMTQIGGNGGGYPSVINPGGGGTFLGWWYDQINANRADITFLLTTQTLSKDRDRTYDNAFNSALNVMGDVRFFFPYIDRTEPTIRDISYRTHNGVALTDIQAWATPPGRLDYSRYRTLWFDGATNGIYIANHADFQALNSGFTLGALIYVSGNATREIIAKYDATLTQREFRLYLDVFGIAHIEIYDETNTAWLGRKTAALTNGNYYFLFATYDGSGLVGGLKIWGVTSGNISQLDTTDEGAGAFAAIVAKTSKVTVGFRYDNNAPTEYHNSYLSMPFLTSDVLTEVKLWQLYRHLGSVLAGLSSGLPYR